MRWVQEGYYRPVTVIEHLDWWVGGAQCITGTCSPFSHITLSSLLFVHTLPVTLTGFIGWVGGCGRCTTGFCTSVPIRTISLQTPLVPAPSMSAQASGWGQKVYHRRLCAIQQPRTSLFGLFYPFHLACDLPCDLFGPNGWWPSAGAVLQGVKHKPPSSLHVSGRLACTYQ